MQHFTKKVISFFLDILQTVVLALSIFVISYLFLFQPHQVKGNSMFPNFQNDDFLLTDKISYRFNDPQRGDVVVFKAPPSEPCSVKECEYIKRVIGLPGEAIRVSDNVIFVNDMKLNEDFLSGEVLTRPGSYLREGQSLKLDEDEYLLLGDNRPYSRDGREFGPIKKERFIGKAWFIYWPPGKLGVVQRGEFK